MVDIFKAVFLGFVQGITEFLPISSSGHLSLFQHFLGVGGDGSLLLSVMLHLGTLAAVFIVYYKDIWELVLEFGATVKDIIHKEFSFKKMSPVRRMLVMFVISCIPLLAVLIPVGGGELLIDKVKVFSEDTSILAEGICFMLTGVILISGSLRAKGLKNRGRAVNTPDAVVIGVAQTLAALFPGISRSGSTISAGMLCGVSRQYMVKYSFILGIPAILAANVLEFKDAVESGATVSAGPVFAGIITAALVGTASIILLRWILKKDLFKYFGYYCLAIGAVTLIIAIIEKATGVYVGVK